MGYWGIVAISFLAGAIAFALCYPMYRWCGWSPVMWYCIIAIAVPCIPYMTSQYDVLKTADRVVMFMHMSFFMCAFWTYFAYIVYYRGHQAEYESFMARKIAEKYGAPSDDDLLAVKKATYPSYGYTKHIGSGVEREELTSRWEKQKRKRIMMDDPLEWIFESRSKR